MIGNQRKEMPESYKDKTDTQESVTWLLNVAQIFNLIWISSLMFKIISRPLSEKVLFVFPLN